MVMSDGAPARLGRYELIARLATGGMGEIFLARLEGAAGFEKLFVIKRILPHLADDVRFRAMLIGEARIASIMTHPNICQVYELSETAGQLYIVMEYLEGITALPLLHKLSKDARTLEIGFVVGVIQQVIEGLHYAHELRDRGGEELGVVHRDVTPSNIFLTESGIAKILDFGIAKVKDASAHTQTGTVKGKYAYMSPEQLRGAAIDRRADVFALGIVVFEMLALRRLFQRKTDYLTFRAVMEQPIPDVRHYRADCPPALAATVARALDRDPANRFTTARQLGSAILDSITMRQRPWTQGEISDFVRSNFAGDMANRGEQIANAARTGATHDAIPVIVRPTTEAAAEADNETEPDFPAVDSVLSPSLPSASASGGHTSADLETMRVPPMGSPQAIVVVNSKRSWLWPLLAFGMAVIAGGAAVWAVRSPTQGPPSHVYISTGSGTQAFDSGQDRITVGPVDAGMATPPTGPSQLIPPPPPIQPSSSSDGSGSASRPAPPPSRQPAKKHADPDGDVVRAQKRDVDRCVGETNLPPHTSISLVVGAEGGHPKRVSLMPLSVDESPVGICIKKVFGAAVFAASAGDHDMTVTLVPDAAEASR